VEPCPPVTIGDGNPRWHSVSSWDTTQASLWLSFESPCLICHTACKEPCYEQVWKTFFCHCSDFPLVGSSLHQPESVVSITPFMVYPGGKEPDNARKHDGSYLQESVSLKRIWHCFENKLTNGFEQNKGTTTNTCCSLIKTCWLHYDVASTSLKPNRMSPPLTWLVQPMNWIQGRYAAWHMMTAINKKKQLPKSTLFSLCSTEFLINSNFKILNERQ